MPKPGPGLDSSMNSSDLPVCRRFRQRQRAEHAVVDGVVQKQHFARLDQDVGQQNQIRGHQPSDGGRKQGLIPDTTGPITL